MKRMYWRPHKVSRIELGLVMLLAVGGVFAVEEFTVVEKQSHYEEKIEAARRTRRAFEAIRSARIAQGTRFDAEADVAQTGMLGTLMSPVTTNSGHLASKQVSVNPNYGALVLHYLKRLDIEKGDVVAVGFSGSFPAINVAVIAAIETIGAEPLIISSVSASQWGANDPAMMWPDMESVLVDRGVFQTRSVAISRGGIEDKALGLTKEGKALIDAAMTRSGARQIRVGNYAASVEERMKIYEEKAGGRPIKAYVNVGGGTSSVGTRIGKRLFNPGINRSAPLGASEIDSVMTRFVLRGVPVVHLIKIAQLADRYGFPLIISETPQVGQGRIFSRRGYNEWLAGGFVLAVLGLMVAFVRRDWGFRVFKVASRRESRKPPEQMV